MFTADEFAEGLPFILKSLNNGQVNASFFFTGNFYRNKNNLNLIRQLKDHGHYLGPHSDKHLLYCDWAKRDSLLVTKEEFSNDLHNNLELMKQEGIQNAPIQYYIPPYEWWNDSIANWSIEKQCQVINFTPGTRTNADYSFPEMGDRYVSTEAILASLDRFERSDPSGLNGTIILVHAGTDPRRTDKLYKELPTLLAKWKRSGYKLVRIDELLNGR